MINKPVAFLVSFLFAIAAHAETHSEDNPDYYKAIPYKPTRIVNLTITTPSAQSQVDLKEDCKDFVMKPKLVKEFFHHARAVSQQVYMHDLDWSACYSEGSVEFANKDKGQWVISRYGSGSLLIKSRNGKPTEKLLFFNCTKCEEWGM